MTLVTGSVSTAVVLAAMPLLGTAKVLADTATGTLLPMVVAEEDLGIGNARPMTGFLTTGQLVGSALGAALFAAGMAWPFLTQSICVALGALLVAHMRLPAVRRREDSRIALDVVEGMSRPAPTGDRGRGLRDNVQGVTGGSAQTLALAPSTVGSVDFTLAMIAREALPASLEGPTRA